MKTHTQWIIAVVISLMVVGCGGSSSNSSSNNANNNINAPIYAYVTDNGNFKVIDVTNPSSPLLLDMITTFDSSYKVSTTQVNNTPFAYVAEYGVGGNYVNIVDLTDKYNLTYTSVPKNNILGKVRDFYMDGSTAYIADEFHGLHVVDLSQLIFNPSFNYGGDAVAVTKFNDDLFLVYQNVNNTGQFGIEKLDISNPANVISTGVFNTVDVNSGVFDIYASLAEYGDNHIFVANVGNKNLVKLDPNTLQKISEVDIAGQPTALSIADGYAYITMHPSATPPFDNGDDMVKVVDLSIMAIVDTKVLQEASGVAIYDDKVYVTDSLGLHIYTTANGIMTLVNTYSLGNGNNITLGQ